MNDLSQCPYYLGTGTCFAGCSSEPSCITDEPSGGWHPTPIADEADGMETGQAEARSGAPDGGVAAAPEGNPQ